MSDHCHHHWTWPYFALGGNKMWLGRWVRRCTVCDMIERVPQ